MGENIYRDFNSYIFRHIGNIVTGSATFATEPKPSEVEQYGLSLLVRGDHMGRTHDILNIL